LDETYLTKRDVREEETLRIAKEANRIARIAAIAAAIAAIAAVIAATPVIKFIIAGMWSNT
jgi:hypothetical protein